MSTSLNRAHPANLALLTVATMGANAVAGCAPSVILAHLSAEELYEFRVLLESAQKAAADTCELIDLQIASRNRPTES